MRIRTITGKLALACAAGLALGLGAQAALADTAPGTLPPEHHAGDISYVSGGIGSDQSGAFKAAEHKYPLSLEFAGHTNDDGNVYLADVPVTIKDSQGNVVLKAHANGPYMLISLPDGKYVVSADNGGNTVTHTVQVGHATHTHQMFFWANAKE